MHAKQVIAILNLNWESNLDWCLGEKQMSGLDFEKGEFGLGFQFKLRIVVQTRATNGCLMILPEVGMNICSSLCRKGTHCSNISGM